jgi:MFS family permease
VTRSETQVPDGVGEHRSLRDYRLLLSAFVISTAGDWLYKLALPLLVLSLTGSALQTAVVYSLEYVPYLLFAMAGGVISDRYDRRLLLISADSAAAVLIGVLAVLAWFNQYHLWSIYLAAFLLSTITPLYQASFLAILPSTVPPDRLGWANSRMQAGQSTLDLAGPLLGAGAVAALGARWALSLDSASFALSALAVALIVRAATHRPERAQATVADDLRVAVRFVLDTPILLWGAIAAAGSSLGLSMIEANMLSYLVRYRHQPVAAVGIVFAALGGGALIGALLAPRIGKLARSGQVIIGSVLVGGIGTALLLVLHPLVTIAAAWVLVGASTAVFIVTFFTLRHQIVPQHLLGRVVVMTRLVAYVTVPIAPLIGGALLSATGSFTPVIVVSAAAQIGVAVVALCTPLRTASAPAPAE